MEVSACPERNGHWHPLRWNGLPDGDDIPAFSDARVREVPGEAARTGLKPRDDGELLPVLLKLVAARTSVAAWPTRMTAKQKTERARELARARAAAADRACTDREAAELLGIPPDKLPTDIVDDRFWTGSKDAPMEFRAAVVEAAGHLRETAGHLADYPRRRDALKDWALPQQTWRALATLLPEAPGKQPILDDRKRQVASISVWTRVTGGEHIFAPRPIEQAQPEHTRSEWAACRTPHSGIGSSTRAPDCTTPR